MIYPPASSAASLKSGAIREAWLCDRQQKRLVSGAWGRVDAPASIWKREHLATYSQYLTTSI